MIASGGAKQRRMSQRKDQGKGQFGESIKYIY